MSEPVGIEQLMISLASALVSARQFLDDEAARMRELYASHEDLARLPQPRFTLDEVTFDLSVVVDDVQAEGGEPPRIHATRDVALGERELSSLKRGAESSAAEQLDALLADYQAVKDHLRSAHDESLAIGPLGAAVKLNAAQLQVLKLGASRTAVSRLDQLLDDYQASRSALLVARSRQRRGPVPQLRVRIDPESIAKAPDIARQRIQVTFRGEEIDAPVVREQDLAD
ncbi:MAG: hypothetical protein J5I93_09010 [Pirellulaceae bacterium]|nr:hypothetical protein [Pirellulaceae bacterium]